MEHPRNIKGNIVVGFYSCIVMNNSITTYKRWVHMANGSRPLLTGNINTFS